MDDKDLNLLCKDYKIFIDTCSWMHECSRSVFGGMCKHLHVNNAKIILPSRVLKELQHHSKKINPDDHSPANAAITLISSLQKRGLIDLRGEGNEVAGNDKRFADNLILTMLQKFRQAHNLCLITQDKALAEDALNIKCSKAVLSNYDLAVLFISSGATLVAWEYKLATYHNDNKLDENERKKMEESAKLKPGKGRSNHVYQSKESRENKRKINSNDKFKICDSPKKEKDEILDVEHIPGTGEFVTSSKYGKILLKKSIGAGGEGIVFATGKRGLVCKVYKKNKITSFRKEKIELMLSKPFSLTGVCWPKDIILNDAGQFIGYLMPEASGKSLQRSVFVIPVIKENFPQWSRINLVQLALTITQTVKSLHDLNIIIGDINPENILVENDKKIFFVDTDSYQVEKFPCPVGTIRFTPPGLQGKAYSDILRTKEQEMFAVATLIFTILFPGKYPYSCSGGADLADNIKKGNFPYIRKEGELDSKPMGAWANIWSHLSRRLKYNFEMVFSDQNEIKIEAWLEALNLYLNDIKKGESSSEILPNARNITNGVDVKCSKCGQESKVTRNFFEDYKISRDNFKCQKCKEFDKFNTNNGKYSKYGANDSKTPFRSSKRGKFSHQGNTSRPRCMNRSSKKGNPARKIDETDENSKLFRKVILMIINGVVKALSFLWTKVFFPFGKWIYYNITQ